MQTKCEIKKIKFECKNTKNVDHILQILLWKMLKKNFLKRINLGQILQMLNK